MNWRTGSVSITSKGMISTLKVNSLSSTQLHSAPAPALRHYIPNSATSPRSSSKNPLNRFHYKKTDKASHHFIYITTPLQFTSTAMPVHLFNLFNYNANCLYIFSYSQTSHPKKSPNIVSSSSTHLSVPVNWYPDRSNRTNNSLSRSSRTASHNS